MQKLSRHRIAGYIASQLAASAPAGDLAQQVAAYLIDTRQTAQVDLLLGDVNKILAKQYYSMTIQAITAHAMTMELRDSVIAFIKQREDVQSVELQEAIDPSVIGGIIIRTPNAEFDSSIRTQLKTLRNSKETRK